MLRRYDSHLRRLGAQTIARFFVCMLVMELKVASRERCLMRNSSVLQKKSTFFFLDFKIDNFSLLDLLKPNTVILPITNKNLKLAGSVFRISS